MASYIQFFLLLPFMAFVISLFLPKKKENLISGTAFVSVGIHLLSLLVFVTYWIFNGHQTIDVKQAVIFQSDEYSFFIDFYFDKITGVYILVGALLTFLVAMYCRAYLHREKGYKRFFNTILFFYLGYNIIIFSGNFETLFIGWEILGISSFLLIAFYRDRYLPVKNAVKVFSIYRLGDVGLILAMWMSHHLWHENITFSKLTDSELVHTQLQTNGLLAMFISLMMIVSAAAKSAQLPFSSWLPRAMEGPTPSSAIFYGSLSVHLGVFILLRTFPFWEHQLTIRILIALMGLFTSLVASGIARVQSSIKSQIAYSSISQIGIIFIEVAAGFEKIALFHFAGNAFLRTYQLLVSPSVVSYLIREQFYNFTPKKHLFQDSIPKKLIYSMYILCIKEWNLGSFMNLLYWRPLKWAGNQLNFLTVKGVLIFFVPAYLIGIICLWKDLDMPPIVNEYLPTLLALVGLIMVLKSFTERKNIEMSWLLIILNNFWIALAILFNEHFELEDIFFYLSGAVVSSIIGYLCLRRLRKLEKNIDLSQFSGHSYEHPKIALVFLLSCLGLAGFPISPTFIGVDLIFSHIQTSQVVLAFIISLSFIITGLSLIRMYARIFLGRHIKTYHDNAFRSS